MKAGDKVKILNDLTVNLQPFLENITISAGTKGIVKGLDIEQTYKGKARGHKIRFEGLDFNVEVMPDKFELDNVLSPYNPITQ
jgi:hypothetical protein